MTRHLFRSVLLAVLLAACSEPVVRRAGPVPVTPARVTEQTTTTTTAPPTTTTAEPAPVTTLAPARPVTTLPRVTQTTQVATHRAATAPATTGSGACGGDLPPCHVLSRESGGNIRAVGEGQCSKDGTVDCYGKWQIHPDTAEAYGYPRRMDLQPEEVQDQAAREILAAGGCSQWSTC